MEPPIVFLPPDEDLPARFIIRVPSASPARVAMLGDDEEKPLATSMDIYEHAKCHVWPKLLESVERREITPVGHWVLLIIPKEVSHHGFIAPDICADIDAALADDPKLRIMYMAEIIDSRDLEGIYPIGVLN